MTRTLFFVPCVLILGCPAGGGGGTGGGSAGGLIVTGAGGGSGGSGTATGGGSTAGGSSSAGGGSTGGGTAGGAATGGGTTGPAPGAFTITDFVFRPKVVTSSDGAFHLVHETQNPGSIVYGRCTGNCGSRTAWIFVTIEPRNFYALAPKIAVGPDGRVHVVFMQTNTDLNAYMTCAANCTVASNWTKTEFPAPNGCDFDDQHTDLVLDTAGRLTFMSSEGNTENLCVNTCGSNCSTPGNWQTGDIFFSRVSGRRIQHALTGHGTTLHLVFDDLAAGLRYQSCTSNCTQASSWQRSDPLFYHVDTPIALSASPQGRLSLVFNQGTTAADAPADVKQFDGRLQLWECQSGCNTRASWQGIAIGNADDGKNGVATTSLPGGIVSVSTQPTGTRAFVCETNCGAGPSWTLAELETAGTLTAALPDPYSVLGCTDSAGQTVRATIATWSPEAPAVAASAQGLVVHTGSGGLRTCPGLTSSAAFPGYGRVIFSPP